jgi:hypothetical protein
MKWVSRPLMRTDITLLPQSISRRAWMTILARLRLVVRRDGVLEVEEDDIGRRLGGLFEQLRLGTRDRQFAAIQPGGRLFDDLEAHGVPQLVNGAAS